MPDVRPPERVTLAAAGIDAEVVPVGVEPDGQMELPENPDVLGWYMYGAAAGDEQGSVVLAGHVDSAGYGLGQLARLGEAAPGDEVVIETTDDRNVRYIVDRVESFAKSELPTAEIFHRGGEERLVMITCGGDFDERAGSYSENTVVTAVRA
nr:class F sortase [Phytoactinopolyspora alkaliphila]